MSLLPTLLAPTASAQPQPPKPRLLVLTDIGGDPDDQQSMVRLMTFSNQFQIEGLIASASGTPGELKKDLVQPQLIRQIVEAFGQVRDNLEKHEPGFPPATQLLDRIKSGNPKRGVASLGATHDTEGSNWIISVVDRPDPRPVNITIWGGSTELAQALWRVRNDRTPQQLQQFLSRIRVHDIAHQDDTGPWIVREFPDLFYILSKSAEGKDRREAVFRGMYLGGDESLVSRQWMETNIRTNHGPLGALYPPNTWTAPNPHSAMKEGDTPSWLYFLPNGLHDPDHPEWGGFGGRFQRAGKNLYRDAADTIEGKTDVRATVWRWRPAFQAEFQARMDWCVKPIDQANHPPVAAFKNDRSRTVIYVSAAPGQRLDLDASASTDPDGHNLSYRWFIYTEAGTIQNPPPIDNATQPRASLAMPANAPQGQLHVILEVKDDGDPPLYAYRRIAVDVDRR